MVNAVCYSRKNGNMQIQYATKTIRRNGGESSSAFFRGNDIIARQERKYKYSYQKSMIYFYKQIFIMRDGV